MGLAARSTDRAGAAAVEFALVAIPVFLFVFGTFEFGRLILAQHTLTTAARWGARMAGLNTDVNGDDENHSSSSQIEDAIRPLLAGQGLRDIRVRIYHVEDPATDWATHATLQHRIAVDLTANYQPMTPLYQLINGGTMASIPVFARSITYSEGH